MNIKFLLTTALLASSLFGHQFFIKENSGNYEVGFWADTHWGQFQADKLFGINAKDKDGKKINAGFDYQNAKIFVDGKPAMMTIMYDFGYYTFTKDGKHYAQRRDTITDKTGANEVKATRRIFKMGKSIFKWSDEAKKPLGMKLEIIALNNPLKLKTGDKLKLKVLLDGKAAKGIEFEDQNGDIEGIATNNVGEATITLSAPKDGYQIIGAGIKLPYNLDMYGDTLQLTSTLSFKSK